MLRPRAPAGYKGLLSSLGSASTVTWGQGGDVLAASSCVQGQRTLGLVLHHAPGMGM